MSIGVSIHEVAKAAGVSPTTVSQALRDVGRISKSTRARVKRLAQEMGYHPNPILSSLASKQFRDPKVVGQTPVAVIAIEVTGNIGKRHHLPETFQGYFADLGYRAELHRITQEKAIRPLLDRLYHQGFQGLVLSSVNLERLPEDVGWERFSIVRAGPVTCPVPFHRVDRDVAGTVRQGLRILLERGYRRLGIALYRHRPAIEDDFDRLGAVLSFRELAPTDAVVLAPLLTRPEETESYLGWARRYKPDAVFNLNGWSYFQQAEVDPNWNRQMGTLAFEVSEDPVLGRYIAGFHSRQAERGRASAIVLDQLIRHGEKGVPAVPRTVLVPAEFRDNSSLPPKAQLRDPNRAVFPGWAAYEAGSGTLDVSGGP